MSEKFHNPDGIACEECDDDAEYVADIEGTSHFYCEDHLPEVAGGRTNSQHGFVR